MGLGPKAQRPISPKAHMPSELGYWAEGPMDQWTGLRAFGLKIQLKSVICEANGAFKLNLKTK